MAPVRNLPAHDEKGVRMAVQHDRTALRSQYDAEAQAWVVDHSQEPKRYYYKTQFKSLYGPLYAEAAAAVDQGGNTAVDLGCGAGAYSFELASFGFSRVYALDFSQPMLDCLKRKAEAQNVSNIAVVQADARRIPLADNSAAVVSCVGLMECLEHCEPAMDEIRRVLKPGGKAFIRWINGRGVWGCLEWMRGAVGHWSGIANPHYFTLEEVLGLCRSSKLKLVRLEGVMLFPLFVLPFTSLLESLIIKTGLCYLLEGKGTTSRAAAKCLYYAFVTELEK